MKFFNKIAWDKTDPKKKKILKMVIGGIAGAGLGFLYYAFIGCNSGTCAITSNPYISTIYGLVFGILISSF